MKGSIKAPHDTSYDNITLKALADIIANKHGYQVAISPELANIQFEHIDQRAESDLNLLTRLTKENNAIAKAMANKLYIVTKGDSKNIRNQPLPIVHINDPHNSKGRVTINERNDYQSVQTYWFSEEKQQKIQVIVGGGEPKYTLRDTYKTADQAKRMAEGKLNKLKRGKKSLSLIRPLSPEIVAESKLIIANHKASANGEWVVKTVEHTVGSGSFSETSIEGVLPRK
ncbi:contractile injection system protein, VgrG/Pvc8 family [Spartinivicinus sp. A2-2]|uniref:Contractile injection system protein, VgrG/Pvc8 family n=2 Tax=Spartinivicinus poritis TaxID=2994640 RepID=A0ABT5UIP5_9GAMM|nr:contractile injection system protein, VgrG/Pvc8 family [Spartinivicinus sp. A2-2]